tara:strand:- start:371 stop:1534 length:1164 start_codon:yes stop_codon:yes gene_type:complete
MNNHIKLRNQNGFSLVELMVGAVIGLFLTTGAIGILVTSKQTYNVQDDLARIQENARFAMGIIVRDLRMAGYFGCHDNLTNISNNLNGGAVAGHLFDATFGIEGMEGTELALIWRPSQNIVDPLLATLGGPTVGDMWLDAVNGRPDALTLRFLSGTQMPVDGIAMNSGAADIPLAANVIGLQPGDLAGIADCGSADIFRVTNAATPVNALQHDSGLAEWDNSDGALSRAYTTVTDGASVTTSVVGLFNSVRYYIGRGAGEDGIANNADDIPSLFRRVYDRTLPGYSNTELVEGVEDFQITYGVDTTGDGLPNGYIEGDDNLGAVDLTTAAGWQSVVGVRIGIMFVSPVETSNDIDNNNYNVNNSVFDPVDDRRRRRVFTSTVQIRNL